MVKMRKRWHFIDEKVEMAEQLGNHLGISTITANLLINRGITQIEDAKAFLYGGVECLEDPFLLQDVEKAAKRIILAVDRREKITIYGDYDVDGITSTALLYRILCLLGATVEFYIPDRQSEGYGLNGKALKDLFCSGTSLLVTVDCGITAVDEVALLAGKMDVIITDHHRPLELLPEAYAIVDPHKNNCGYPNKNLAGVGVAFKLCQALWFLLNRDIKLLFPYLDLVAIGTVADIVSLIGENRVLVKLGLQSLRRTKNIGLQSLLATCGLHQDLDAGKIGFVIGPRLNAIGRMGRADAGVELLITDDRDKAVNLAARLDDENVQRQAIEQSILAEAEEFLKKIDVTKAKVIVLSGEKWHPGVIGIVASRIVEKYYRPAIIISIENGIGKGSCRSIPGFDLFAALQECENLLTRFGGHRMAAGLTIPFENINELKIRMSDIAERELIEEDYVPELRIDSVVTINEINNTFLEEMTCLEPHGIGNPRPIFASRGVLLAGVYKMGKDKQHLKCKVIQQRVSRSVVGWGMGSLADQIQIGQQVDIAFNPESNEWQGQRSIQLRAQDIRNSSRTSIDSREGWHDSARIVIGQVYLILKHHPQGNCGFTNQEIIQEIRLKYKTILSNRGLNISLAVLEELSLIELYNHDGTRFIRVLASPEKKLDITSSKTFCESGLQHEIS